VSLNVLLVDGDVDALGALASALRARGLVVFNASDAFEAVEQAFQNRPDCVLVDRRLDLDGLLTDAFRAVPELTETPLFHLVPTPADEVADDDVARSDVDKVAGKILGAAPRVSRANLENELTGNLEQMPLSDLMQLLAMNRRSGVVAITTLQGAGELRISEGEVVDAMFRRVEGEKAIYRLLGEREGRFTFTAGEVRQVRRITRSTSALLMEAMRQVDEIAHRRRELAPSGEALLLEEPPSVRPGSSRPPDWGPNGGLLFRELTQLLLMPRSIDELLDDLDVPDLEVLEALTSLAAAHKIRRVPISEVTSQFAPLEQLPVIRSLVRRLARLGFAAPPRLVIAAPAARMPALAHAVRRIGDAVAPTDLPPRAPIVRLLGTLRLGDGVELALIGLPTDPLFSPMWALALAGAAVVVRLHEAGGKTLEAQCDQLEVTLIDAESLMGALDAAVPSQVAALVKSALEMAAGV
jgi:CheY-like chemotaxis protein